MKAKHSGKKEKNNKTTKAAISASPAITSDKSYEEVMTRIDMLMSKGSKNVNSKELAEIKELALKAQAYENKKYVIPEPTTLAGIVEMKMYEMRLKQKDLANILRISNAKLSLILGGKQKPDIAFLKAIHQEFKIDANLLLNAM